MPVLTLEALAARLEAVERTLAALMKAQQSSPANAAALIPGVDPADVWEAATEADAGRLTLCRPVYGRNYQRRVDADRLRGGIVATLAPQRYPLARGDDEAEATVLEPAAANSAGSRVHILRSDADPGWELEQAEVVVTAGGGVKSAACFAAIERLADALGGQVAVTRAAFTRGLGSREREVGVGARHIAPRLYIACAASGSNASPSVTYSMESGPNATALPACAR